MKKLMENLQNENSSIRTRSRDIHENLICTDMHMVDYYDTKLGD